MTRREGNKLFPQNAKLPCQNETTTLGMRKKGLPPFEFYQILNPL
jgi:hypothetical protein